MDDAGLSHDAAVDGSHEGDIPVFTAAGILAQAAAAADPRSADFARRISARLCCCETEFACVAAVSHGTASNTPTCSCAVTRDVGVGGHQYTDFIQKEFNLGFAQAQALKHGEPVDGMQPSEARHIIESVNEIICLEIQKTFDFFKTTTTVERIDRMLVSGGAAHTPGLVETLARKFDIQTEKFDSFKNVTYDSKRFPPSLIANRSPDLAVAVGLALRSAEE